MSQTQPKPTPSTIPPELRLDFTELAEDILTFHYEDGITNASDNPDSQLSSNTTPGNSGNHYQELIRRANRMRRNLQRAQEAAKKIQSCDLDVAAQEKLLLSVATSCVAKRQLVCQLKKELAKLQSKDSYDNYLEGSTNLNL